VAGPESVIRCVVATVPGPVEFGLFLNLDHWHLLRCFRGLRFGAAVGLRWGKGSASIRRDQPTLTEDRNDSRLTPTGPKKLDKFGWRETLPEYSMIRFARQFINSIEAIPGSRRSGSFVAQWNSLAMLAESRQSVPRVLRRR
jgi:hypothetical protein